MITLTEQRFDMKSGEIRPKLTAGQQSTNGDGSCHVKRTPPDIYNDIIYIHIYTYTHTSVHFQLGQQSTLHQRAVAAVATSQHHVLKQKQDGG